MFSRRQKELEFYQKAIENMEACTKSNELICQKAIENMEACAKNNELMISTIGQLVDQAPAPEVKQEELMVAGNDGWSDEEKRQAAYALNLCTVSVSQIIDYDDENILEQEYETILNNLNLENMPKDEALLNILKQILDTVTFFRIQEGDKALLEKEYQQKMKNAIWSSVPNFGMIIATGNPFAMVVSLASQVGIGYMNYRKQKAEIGLSKEKSEWQLQRAAIEQLNALRRELFDASWRLADRYGFSDEYRLTEKQIAQYNKILMDPDDVKRYERLDAIKDKFVAYPAFWYHFGHAANCIAQAAQCGNDLDNSVYSEYKSKAMEYFERFMNSDKHSLLRDDPITSSCALEFVDLLSDSEADKERIKGLLKRAINSCGGACDIIQLSAMAYLRIGEFSDACVHLKYLVNEDYNAQMNSQLLSALYVRELMAQPNDKLKAEYRILEKKRNVSRSWLFPLPVGKESMKALNERFITKQKERLRLKFKYVFERYSEKCEARFNKCVPVPDVNMEYEDVFFSNVGDYGKERVELYEKCLRNESKRLDFLSRLTESHFTLEYIDVLNETLNGFERLWPEVCDMDSIADIVRKTIETKKDSLNKMQLGVTGEYDYKQLFSDIDDYGFRYFMAESMTSYVQTVSASIENMKNMIEFTKRDMELNEFCKAEGIEEYLEPLGNTDAYEMFDGHVLYLPYDLLGEEAEKRAESVSKIQKMTKMLEERIPKIVGNTKDYSSVIYVKPKGNDTKSNFYKYFADHQFKWYNDKKAKQDVFAVMLGSNIAVPDIILTKSGIRCISSYFSSQSGSTIVDYEKVKMEDNKLIVDEKKYTHNKVNILELHSLIQEYAEFAKNSGD